MAAELSPSQVRGKDPILIGAVIWLTLIACVVGVPLSCAGVASLHLFLTTSPGIGDVDQANLKLKLGMTKDEVRALLGSPHSTGACGGDEWDYWQNRAASSILRVHFGPDGRVSSKYCWVQ